MGEIAKEQAVFIDTLDLTEGQALAVKVVLEEGLTKEQIEFMNKPGFNGMQMIVAGAALNNGLTEEQILEFYKPEIPYTQMFAEAKRILANGKTSKTGA